MASLPSGYRNEELELVFIETEDFTLSIKGKPFHEKYESLRQYRAMDRKEVMTFKVSSEKDVGYEVFDVKKGALSEEGPFAPIFFENGVYQVIITSNTDEPLSFYHEHPSFRKAISPLGRTKQQILAGNLHFQNEIGFSSFEIRKGNECLLEVEMEIFPTKLEYKEDFKQLLEEVNEEIYNLAYDFLRKTYLRAGKTFAEKPSMTEFYRLLQNHYDDLIRALNFIERQPHHQLKTTYKQVRGDQLKKVDSYSRNYLRKRPHLFMEVQNGIPLGDRRVMPVKGMNPKKELSFDTLENRFVKWMMIRIKDRIDDLLKKLESVKGPFFKEPDEELLRLIREQKKQVEGQLKKPFWQEIGRIDRSVLSLVIQMAPGYKDVYQIFLTIMRGLTINGQLYKLSVKDVATLYEYWTFLKIGQLLATKYEAIDQDVVKVNRNGIFVRLDESSSARRRFRHPVTDEEIVLHFQKRGGKLPTVAQKPDTMLSIEKKGKDFTYNYIFDAKYRIDFAIPGTYYGGRYGVPGPMEEDINTMHRYRDALVVEQGGPYERDAYGAYVLFPSNDDLSFRNHHFYKSINEVNVGAFPFLPSSTELLEQFIDHLIESSPDELMKNGILPRGFKEDWNSALDEAVLVGVVNSLEDFRAYRKGGFYCLPASALHGGRWQDARHVALYVTQSVSGEENGIRYYGKVQRITPKVGRNIEGISIDSDEEYLYFKIKYWLRVEEFVRPVNYGISSYVMTTLNTLKQARELPEIFMKSSEEVALWRMLRRISHDIKVVLDDRMVDQASRVKSYGLGELVVEVDSDASLLRIVRGEVKIKEIALKELEERPSGVFREVVGLMEQI